MHGSYHWRLKDAATESCRTTRTNMGEFMREGFHDFLLDGFTDDDGPHEIAAAMLHRLCDCGRGAFDRATFATVLLFLRNTCPEPPKDQLVRCGQDLLQMVRSGASIREYMNWCQLWFS